MLRSLLGGTPREFKRAGFPAYVAAAAFVAVASAPAWAQTDKVYGPTVHKGEFEVEARGFLDFDDDADKDGKQKYKFDMGYGVTDFWWTEIVFELEKEGEDDANLFFEAIELENIFELRPEDNGWPALGLYTALEIPKNDDMPFELEWKGLIQKSVGPTRHRLNLNFEWKVGRDAGEDIELGYAWQSKWKLWDLFSPGFEAYGDFGEISDFKSGREQKHQIGPVVWIEHELAENTKIELLTGYFFGLTPASADGTYKFQLEFKTQF
jgi:hypothetical protein